MTTQAQGRAFTAQDALSVQTLMPYARPTVAPDGHYVAFATMRPITEPFTCSGCSSTSDSPLPRFAHHSELRLVEAASGRQLDIQSNQAASWGPAWSPDGELLAFYSDRDGTLGVWLWVRDSGRLQKVEGVRPQPSTIYHELRWTPDSMELLVPAKPGADNSKLSAQADGSAQNNAMAVNDASVVLQHSDGVDDQSMEGFRIQTFKALPDIDLVTVNVREGKVAGVAKNVSPWNYWFSPNGQRLAYVVRNGRPVNPKTSTSQYTADLWICELKKERSCRLAVGNIVMSSNVLATPVTWSPDSQSLAYVADGHFDGNVEWLTRRGDCFVISARGGTPKKLTSDSHPPFDNASVGPLWSAQGDALYLLASFLSSDNDAVSWNTDAVWQVSLNSNRTQRFTSVKEKRILAILANSDDREIVELGNVPHLVAVTQDEETGKSAFASVDLRSGAVDWPFEDSVSFGSQQMVQRFLKISDDRKTVVHAMSSSTRPLELSITDSALRIRRPVIDINPGLGDIEFGQTQLFSYESLDGKPLKAALLRPANFVEGHRYPLIVWTYGGTFMATKVFQFGIERGDSLGATLNTQVLASNGYAVLVPDAPISEGTVALDFLKSVMPAVNKVVEMGVADPKRCGILGHSFGGYAVLALITQTSRFKAAVSYGAPSDWVSIYGALPGIAESGQARLGGLLPHVPMRYIQNSPVFFLDHVHTPVLLMHGDLDPVPIAQPEEIFNGLRRLDKPVTFARYVGEGHILSRPANIVDYWVRVLGFFDHSLRGGDTTTHDGR